ncbi:sodium:proton antiporter [Poriferisphaera sp. WC338]|uniref:sodium:proton antiporter n=1 Tax=Poriferisphaera sp. WC338 TaxID=3425129 RepID=UPI003D8126C3
MTFVLAICVAVTFGVSIYMMLGRELLGLAIGVFLLGHAANLSILTMSGSPVIGHEQMSQTPEFKAPPVLPNAEQAHEWVANNTNPLQNMVDPLPQALILTAIVIGFAVMGFLLTLIVTTSRKAKTLDVNELAKMDLPTPSQAH